MDLYAENILDHFRNPHNKGRLEKPTISADDSNPLCGDKIYFDLHIDDSGKITDVGFSGEGCAISQASASMLTDEIMNKTSQELMDLPNEAVYTMLGVPLTTNRVKCALLSLVVLKKALTFHKMKQ